VEYREHGQPHGQPKDTCLERMKQFAYEYNTRIQEMEREKKEAGA
jgi:hypothetical protein